MRIAPGRSANPVCQSHLPSYPVAGRSSVKHAIACLGFLMLLGPWSAAQETAAPTFRAYKQPVMTWVPPYAVAKAKAKLTSDLGMSDALTHLGLQFWCPTKSGAIERAPFPEPTDQAIAELRDWGHAHGVRVLLCVYNAGTGKWDWPLARAAFADKREIFVKSLVAEVGRLKLDGVDMDLEGNGEFPDADRVAFIAMMTDLCKELRA